VSDQISDAILDAIFKQDPKSRVAAETLCNTGLVVLAGEITTNANVDYIQVARDTLKRIGYDDTEYGIDYKGCAVLVAYDKQSNDIAQGVDHASDDHTVWLNARPNCAKMAACLFCAPIPRARSPCVMWTANPTASTLWCCPANIRLK
jgi:S-adenosylmethionine synthetase